MNHGGGGVQSLSCVKLFLTPWVIDLRLLRPWDFPGKNTGEWAACYSLLQGIFPSQGLNPCFLHWQVDSLLLSHQGSPSIPFGLQMKKVFPCLEIHHCWGLEKVLKDNKTQASLTLLCFKDTALLPPDSSGLLVPISSSICSFCVCHIWGILSAFHIFS